MLHVDFYSLHIASACAKDDGKALVAERAGEGDVCIVGLLIDVVGFHNGAPVVGYCSGKAYWGNGYMTEALSAVVKELFENGFDTIVIEAVDENIASNKVILKNGFKLVATRNEALSPQKADNIVTINSYRLYK